MSIESKECMKINLILLKQTSGFAEVTKNWHKTCILSGFWRAFLSSTVAWNKIQNIILNYKMTIDNYKTLWCLIAHTQTTNNNNN